MPGRDFVADISGLRLGPSGETIVFQVSIPCPPEESAPAFNMGWLAQVIREGGVVELSIAVKPSGQLSLWENLPAGAFETRQPSFAAEAVPSNVREGSRRVARSRRATEAAGEDVSPEPEPTPEDYESTAAMMPAEEIEEMATV